MILILVISKREEKLPKYLTKKYSNRLIDKNYLLQLISLSKVASLLTEGIFYPNC